MPPCMANRRGRRSLAKTKKIADCGPGKAKTVKGCALCFGMDINWSQRIHGQDAMAHLEQEPDITLALINMTLPDMEGYRVLGQIRRGGAQVRTLALVEASSPGSREQALALGAEDTLEYPGHGGGGAGLPAADAPARPHPRGGRAAVRPVGQPVGNARFRGVFPAGAAGEPAVGKSRFFLPARGGGGA